MTCTEVSAPIPRTEVCTGNAPEIAASKSSRARARLPYGEGQLFGASVQAGRTAPMHRTEDAAATAPHFSAVQVAPEDPSAAYRDARARRAAYAAWERAGSNIDDLPAGLLSACLHAAMTRPGKPGPRW